MCGTGEPLQAKQRATRCKSMHANKLQVGEEKYIRTHARVCNDNKRSVEWGRAKIGILHIPPAKSRLWCLKEHVTRRQFLRAVTPIFTSSPSTIYHRKKKVLSRTHSTNHNKQAPLRLSCLFALLQDIWQQDRKDEHAVQWSPRPASCGRHVCQRSGRQSLSTPRGSCCKPGRSDPQL